MKRCSSSFSLEEGKPKFHEDNTTDLIEHLKFQTLSTSRLRATGTPIH